LIDIRRPAAVTPLAKDPRPPVEVAVGVVWRDDGRVLLADRPVGKPYAGYWEFPGGKIETGETVAHALARELDEELGISVQRSDPWLCLPFSYPHAHVRLHFCRVRAWSGEPTAREGQHWCFADPQAPAPGRLLPAAVPVWRSLALATTCLRSPGTCSSPDDAVAWFTAAIARGARLILWDEPHIDRPSAAETLARIGALAWSWQTSVFVRLADDGSQRHVPGIRGSCLHLAQLRHGGTQRPRSGWLAAEVQDLDDLQRARRLGCEFVVGPLDLIRQTNERTCPYYVDARHELAPLQTALNAGAQGIAIRGLRGL
jgi:8-oxo-dGTP diphosphatase